MLLNIIGGKGAISNMNYYHIIELLHLDIIQTMRILGV